MAQFTKADRQRIIDSYLSETGRNMFVPGEFIDWLADNEDHEAYDWFFAKMTPARRGNTASGWRDKWLPVCGSLLRSARPPQPGLSSRSRCASSRRLFRRSPAENLVAVTSRSIRMTPPLWRSFGGRALSRWVPGSPVTAARSLTWT